MYNVIILSDEWSKIIWICELIWMFYLLCITDCIHIWYIWFLFYIDIFVIVYNDIWLIFMYESEIIWLIYKKMNDEILMDILYIDIMNYDENMLFMIMGLFI